MTQAFRPMSGRTDRSFAKVWQAVRYETGYSAQELFLPAESHTDEFYRLGRQDKKAEQLQYTQKLATRLREHYAPKRDIDWSGLLIVAVGVAATVGAYLIAMSSDYRVMP